MGAACGILGIAALLSATAAPPAAQSTQTAIKEVTLYLDPVQSKVHYMVDTTLHTVHGTFALKAGSAVQFDSETGKASGEVAVYATSGESGNSSRDERMHKEILQTAKYPDAIFRPAQIEGKVALTGASDVKLRGVLLLHGGEHEIVADVHAEMSGDHWTGTAKFDVPYIQWGIKDPSNWLLKVKPVVSVELDMAGKAASAR
ncbi:MAG: YceI family protein [Candidatus Acidiferrum sp.]